MSGQYHTLAQPGFFALGLKLKEAKNYLDKLWRMATYTIHTSLILKNFLEALVIQKLFTRDN